MKKLVEHRNGFNCWHFDRESNIVYLIEIGENKYIGSTENARARLLSHINTLLEGKHQSKNIQDAFNKNKSFTIYLLEKCSSKDEAFNKEKEYIRHYIPNLNHRMYFKEWLLNLSNRHELILSLSKIIIIVMDRIGIRVKELENMLGLNKFWLRKMKSGFIDMNSEQFSTLLKILRLTVIMKGKDCYIRFIRDNKFNIKITNKAAE